MNHKAESYVLETAYSFEYTENNYSYQVENISSINVATDIPNSTLDFEAAVYHKLLENTPAIIFTSVLMVIGIPGNFIVCLVYGKWNNSNSTNAFILSLAVLDLMNCLITCPSEVAMMAQYFEFDFGIICKLSRFSTYFCNTSAALIMVAIAWDRYRRICTPSKTEMTARKARIVILVLVAVSVLVTWPAFFMYGTRSFRFNEHNFRNIFAKNCLLEIKFIKTAIPLSYFAFHCASTIIIFTVVSILYIFVGISICQRWRFRKQFIKPAVFIQLQMIKNQSKENLDEPNMTRETTEIDLSNNGSRTTTTHIFPRRHKSRKTNINIEKTTLMLFFATVTYIVSFLPFLVIAIHRSLYPENYKNMSDAGEMVFQILFRSYLINSAVDPIIYSFFNDQFRSKCFAFLRIG